jgi:hypothetical protein
MGVVWTWGAAGQTGPRKTDTNSPCAGICSAGALHHLGRIIANGAVDRLADQIGVGLGCSAYLSIMSMMRRRLGGSFDRVRTTDRLGRSITALG